MKKQDGEEDDKFETVRGALSGLRYGSIEIVIHDSKIVQIERREKTRIEHNEKRKS